MPIETITPPAPKSAPVPEPTPTPTPSPEPTPTLTPTATPEPAKQEPREIGKKQPPRSRITEIAAKLEAAAQGKKLEPTPTPEPAKPAAEPDKKDETIPSGDKELDAEIETVAKDLSPAQRSAFKHKTYALRDSTRKLKEVLGIPKDEGVSLDDLHSRLQAKIADGEQKGKNTAALEAKLADLESKMAAAPTVDPKQIEDLKAQSEAANKRAQELEQELQVAAVERSPEFQSAITKPKQTIEEAVKALAKKHELPERQLLNALYAGEDEQVTAIENLSDAEKVRFFNYSLKISELDERAGILRQNAAEANQKIALKREEETKAQAETRKAAFAQAHTQNWKSLQDALPILQPFEGDDEITKNWNSNIDSAEKFSRTTDFATLEPTRQSEILQRSSVFPMLVGAIQSKDTAITERDAKITELETELQKFRDNKPSNDPTLREDGVIEKPKGRLAERVAQRLGQITGR